MPGLLPQPGKRGNKTHRTPTPRPPIRNTRAKMAGPTTCKLRASIGTCTPHKQTNRDSQGQPGNQSDPQCSNPPTTVPKGKMPAQQAEGCLRKATARTTKRLHFPP
ncbi:hypothetical protein ATANTOWER_011312 [Ataeniobius toweri]|uniref:Uncharacterized protein n=1 Tax=Ataeniobius toweri TaxID=208326 RepID=A0ABU7CGG0_9TELE|nr:hypothetical protein [Ataeniobius toweri]